MTYAPLALVCVMLALAIPAAAAEPVSLRTAAVRSASFWQQPTPRPNAKSARAVRGAILGAVGGMIVGGLIGATIEQKSACPCADTPIKGFLTGAAIGAVPGGVIGFRLSF